MVKEVIRKYVDFKDTDGMIVFAIESLEGDHVGGINLNSIDYENGTFSFGLRIYRPHRNKGY